MINFLSLNKKRLNESETGVLTKSIIYFNPPLKSNSDDIKLLDYIINFLQEHGIFWAGGMKEYNPLLINTRFDNPKKINYLTIDHHNRVSWDSEKNSTKLRKYLEKGKAINGREDFKKEILNSEDFFNQLNESEENELEWAEEILKSPIKGVVEGQYYRVNNDMSDEPFYYTIDIFVKEIVKQFKGSKDTVWGDSLNTVIYDSLCNSENPNDIEDDNKTDETITYGRARELVETGYWIPITKEQSLFHWYESGENLTETLKENEPSVHGEWVLPYADKQNTEDVFNQLTPIKEGDDLEWAEDVIKDVPLYVTKNNSFIGAKVKRGPDWKFGNQDAGAYGKIMDEPQWVEDSTDEEFHSYWVYVKWVNKNGMTLHTNNYRVGPYYHDLKFFAETKKPIKESEDDGLEWAEDIIKVNDFKWGNIKRYLNDGDVISVSGDICDSEGNVDLVLKDEPFIVRKSSSVGADLRWSNDYWNRPRGWEDVTDMSHDWIRMSSSHTSKWDDELNIKILRQEEYPF